MFEFFSRYDIETMRTEGIKLSNTFLLSVTHKGKVGSCKMGSYGALVSFNKVKDSTSSSEGSDDQSELMEEVTLDMAVVGQQLCQHIVGMNPQSLGNPDAEGEEKDKNTQLLHQEFLMDSDVSVNQWLIENGIQVKDFVRFQCGEELPEDDS